MVSTRTIMESPLIESPLTPEEPTRLFYIGEIIHHPPNPDPLPAPYWMDNYEKHRLGTTLGLVCPGINLQFDPY